MCKRKLPWKTVNSKSDCQLYVHVQVKENALIDGMEVAPVSSKERNVVIVCVLWKTHTKHVKKRDEMGAHIYILEYR